MRAAIFHAPGQLLTIEDLPEPEPQPGEVVLKIARCGVCGTDLDSTSGRGHTLPAGSQLGHEYAGEVVALGKGVENLKIGDRVAAMPLAGCGKCEYCRTGIEALCSTFRYYSEGIAEYARCSGRRCAKLPASVSLPDAALVEPLAVARRGVRMANVQPEDRALIIGPGPIGLAALFWLRRAGVRNIAMLASSGRRRALAEKMGASAFIVEGENALAEIGQALGGPPHVVIEAAGVPGVISRAIEVAAPGGRVVGLGYCVTPDSVVPAVAL
jgi:(R,R)-butanediol dehydrogenase/meso-butanediol dehydrogenase/diacetyl reductase